MSKILPFTAKDGATLLRTPFAPQDALERLYRVARRLGPEQLEALIESAEAFERARALRGEAGAR
jgi:hypothetical protein